MLVTNLSWWRMLSNTEWVGCSPHSEWSHQHYYSVTNNFRLADFFWWFIAWSSNRFMSILVGDIKLSVSWYASGWAILISAIQMKKLVIDKIKKKHHHEKIQCFTWNCELLHLRNLTAENSLNFSKSFFISFPDQIHFKTSTDDLNNFKNKLIKFASDDTG